MTREEVIVDGVFYQAAEPIEIRGAACTDDKILGFFEDMAFDTREVLFTFADIEHLPDVVFRTDERVRELHLFDSARGNPRSTDVMKDTLSKARKFIEFVASSSGEVPLLREVILEGGSPVQVWQMVDLDTTFPDRESPLWEDELNGIDAAIADPDVAESRYYFWLANTRRYPSFSLVEVESVQLEE